MFLPAHLFVPHLVPTCSLSVQAVGVGGRCLHPGDGFLSRVQVRGQHSHGGRVRSSATQPGSSSCNSDPRPSLPLQCHLSPAPQSLQGRLLRTAIQGSLGFPGWVRAVLPTLRALPPLAPSFLPTSLPRAWARLSRLPDPLLRALPASTRCPVPEHPFQGRRPGLVSFAAQGTATCVVVWSSSLPSPQFPRRSLARLRSGCAPARAAFTFTGPAVVHGTLF